MYIVLQTFDNMITCRTHNKGSKYAFKELSNDEKQYLTCNQYIKKSSVRKKPKMVEVKDDA